jgi:hypothetical protein
VHPGKLPAPALEFPEKRLAVLEFNKSVFRSHDVSRHPVFYGKTGRYRFDAPDRSYGALYTGADPYCAFIESLIKNPNSRVVTSTELKKKAVAELRAARPLRLIDLASHGSLMRAGVDSRVFSADHDAAQLWSKAWHDYPIAADGILYPSRLDPARQSVALFDDRAPKLLELSRQTWYAPGPQRHLHAAIVDHYEIELIEDRFVAPRKPVSTAAKADIPLKLPGI